MLITISTSSQTLQQILSAPQKVIANANKKKVSYSVLILNNHATEAIYFEIGAAAVVLEGMKIAAGGSLDIEINTLNDLYLIAANANADVRIVFN